MANTVFENKVIEEKNRGMESRNRRTGSSPY